MSTVEGPYTACVGGLIKTKGQVVRGDQVVCSVDDLQTAELIASALNLWEIGSEDDTLDQLTAAHQMNLALSKRVQELQAQVEALHNKVPTDSEDYGDNLVGTADAMLKKSGKGGSYDLATFDSARMTTVKTKRQRRHSIGEDVVTIDSTIELKKKCIRSGEYGSDDTPVGGFKGTLFGP